MAQEKKPRRLTRDQLIARTVDLEKQIAVLNDVVKENNSFDERVRIDLGELMGHNIVQISNRGYGGYDRMSESVKAPLSWRGIAFKIGELKADADYSTVTAELRNREEQIINLRKRIEVLEQPTGKKKCPCGNPDCEGDPALK